MPVTQCASSAPRCGSAAPQPSIHGPTGLPAVRVGPERTQLPGTSRPRWGQRTYLHPLALRDAFQFSRMPHSNCVPRARSQSAPGPNPNLPTEQRQHCHGASEPPGLITSHYQDHNLASETTRSASPGHKCRLLDITGGLPLGHAPKINPSVAP